MGITGREYQVSLEDRIKELIGDEVLDEITHLTYEWHGGYEKYTLHREGCGTREYSGVHHPNDGLCEGENICRWCGRVLWE